MRKGTGKSVPGTPEYFRFSISGWQLKIVNRKSEIENLTRARFHRPDAGNGLNDLARASIRAARTLESHIKFWEITPHMELLSDRAPNEAYLAAKPGECYALYFTNGGSVGLDLSSAPGAFNITWISISMGRIVESSEKGGYRLMDKTIEGGRVATLQAPYKGGWVAAIVKD